MNVGNYGKSRLSEGSTTLSAKPDSVEVGNRQPCTLSQNDLIQLMNPQTHKFLSKYFPDYYQTDIPVNQFVCYILKQYQGLWTPEQARRVQTHFIGKLASILGCEDTVDLFKLATTTHHNGIIGLILDVFRSLKEEEDRAEHSDIQNLKNVLQEFVEGLYASLENQIYGRFNVEMRRMILKYKEAEKLVKKLNQIINEHADIINHDQQLRQMRNHYEDIIRDLNAEISDITVAYDKQTFLNENLQKQVQRLTAENQKLNSRLEKFQETLIGAYSQPDQSNLPIHSRPSLPISPNPSKKNISSFFEDKKPINLASALQSNRNRHDSGKQNLMDVANLLNPRLSHPRHL